MNNTQIEESEEPEYGKIFRDAWKYEQRTRPLKAFFEKGNIDLEMTDYNPVVRCLYWLKAFICVFLGRNKGSYLGDTICILSYDEYQCYDGMSWQSVWVHKGLLKG